MALYHIKKAFLSSLIDYDHPTEERENYVLDIINVPSVKVSMKTFAQSNKVDVEADNLVR